MWRRRRVDEDIQQMNAEIPRWLYVLVLLPLMLVLLFLYSIPFLKASHQNPEILLEARRDGLIFLFFAAIGVPPILLLNYLYKAAKTRAAFAQTPSGAKTIDRLFGILFIGAVIAIVALTSVASKTLTTHVMQRYHYHPCTIPFKNGPPYAWCLDTPSNQQQH